MRPAIFVSAVTVTLATHVFAGPTFQMPYREVSAIGRPGGAIVTRSNADLGPWTDSVTETYVIGQPPSNNDGATASTSQTSDIGMSGVNVTGNISARTLYSTDNTGSGTVADGLSTLRVVLDIDVPTRFTMAATSSLPAYIDPRSFISVESRITTPDGASVLFSITESTLDGNGDPITSLLGTLQPGQYQFEMNAKPSTDYGLNGQLVAGAYEASLQLAAPAVVPLPPAVFAGAIGLGVAVVMRKRIASSVCK
jgi:hypothetical protein